MPSSDKIQNCSLASLLEACKENCDPFKSKGHLGYLYPTFSACNVEDLGSIPGLRRFPGEGKGYSLQYSGLENPMDCIVLGVTKSQTRLSDLHSFLNLNWSQKYFCLLEALPKLSFIGSVYRPGLKVIADAVQGGLCSLRSSCK